MINISLQLALPLLLLNPGLRKRVLEVLEVAFSAVRQIIFNLSSEKKRHGNPRMNLIEAI